MVALEVEEAAAVSAVEEVERVVVAASEVAEGEVDVVVEAVAASATAVDSETETMDRRTSYP